jgi:hypothetical protein
LIVVVQQVIDGIINGLILISDMHDQIDSVNVLVQEKRLISVEWETFNHKPTGIIIWDYCDLFGNVSGDDFVALSRRFWINVYVQGEDLLKKVINVFSLWIYDNFGNWGESDSVDVLVVVEVLLFVTFDDSLFEGASEILLQDCSHL